MTKLSLLALPLLAGGLFLTGCSGEAVVYDDGPSYYGGNRAVYYGDPNPDFYYAGASPYSRQYGVLIYRDNGYYYRRGNSYVVYNRPAWNRYDYDRYRADNWRSYHVRRDTRVAVREDYDHRHRHNNNNNNNNRKKNNGRVSVHESNQGTHVNYNTNNKKNSNKHANNNNSNKKKNAKGSNNGGGGGGKNKKKNQDDENKKKKKNN